MIKEPKRQNHPGSAYLIGIFVWLIILFVGAGVVNHLAFSRRGPGLLIPLVENIQKRVPILTAFRKPKETEEHLHFHHVVELSRLPDARQTTCRICHPSLSHNKTQKIRAILNMHTNYLACETCHLEIKEDQTVVYKWFSPVETNPQGPFFGTAYDPKTGELEMVQDNFSKIAPFYQENGELRLVAHEQDAPMARDYVKILGQLTAEQKKDRTKRFHVDTLEKGVACQSCHATKGILDFKALGFSSKRTIDIEALNIKGIITKYDEFYLPDLFK